MVCISIKDHGDYIYKRSQCRNKKNYLICNNRKGGGGRVSNKTLKILRAFTCHIQDGKQLQVAFIKHGASSFLKLYFKCVFIFF